MRKAAIIVTVLFATGLVAGADAVISPGSPGDIVLDKSNSFEVTKEFDGSASTPESATYTWSWVENSTSKTGETVDFTFTRQNSRSNTIRLTVTSETDSSNDSVTQTLRDKPEIKSVSPSSSKSLDLNDTDEDGKVDYTVTASNTFDGPLSYEWEDGSGNVVSGQANFTYDFNSTGDYTFTVNVSDSENYFQTKQAAEVSVTDSGSEEENQEQSGQGSGSGGSSILYEEGYIFGDVEDGEVEEASFSESPVTKVTVTFSDSEESTEIESDAEEKIDDLPGGGVDEEPAGNVYRFVEYNTVNFSESDVDNVELEFEVEKSWLEDNDLVEDSLDLEKYDGGDWESMGAEKIDEDDEKLYYEAEGSELPSIGAITAEQSNPNFQVSDISIEPEEPGLNSTVNITVEVENTGNAAGDYTVSLEVAGETKEEDVEDLAPDDSVDVDFSHVFQENGSYTLEAGDESVQVQLGNTEESADAEEVSESDIPWLLIIIAVVMVWIVAASIGFLYIDEERREEILDSAGLPGTEQLKERIPGSFHEEEEEEYEWEGFS